MDFPKTVLTEGKKGKLEVRSLDHRGRYIMCKYLNPKTMKLADAKRKLILKDEEGRIFEYFIIPLKDPKRALLISTETEDKDRQIWNDKVDKAEEMWRD